MAMQPPPAEQVSVSSARSLWTVLERFAQSKVLAALVTIAGTAGLSNWIAAGIQERSRQHELSLVSYKEFLAKELELISSAYELTGAYLSASEDLIFLTGPAFDPSHFPEAARAKLEAQKQQMRDNYNTVDAEWRKRRESLGLLMGYYHPGNPKIGAAWRNLQEAVDGFNHCVVNWVTQHPRATAEQPAAQACGKEKSQVRDRIDDLNLRLDEARTYLWERFGVLKDAASGRPGSQP